MNSYMAVTIIVIKTPATGRLDAIMALSKEAAGGNMFSARFVFIDSSTKKIAIKELCERLADYLQPREHAIRCVFFCLPCV